MNEAPTQTPTPQLQLDDQPVIGENEKLSAHEGMHPLNLDPSGPSKKTTFLDMSKINKPFVAVLLVGAIAAGSLTGFGVHKLQTKAQTGSETGSADVISQVATDNINNGDVFGVPDAETFKDSAEGYLEEGGLSGEGSHHLLRIGGPSQTVYLTSSVTDLDKFQGMQVKVWGETFKGQKAGWLMDVGRVEIINTQGEAPVEE